VPVAVKDANPDIPRTVIGAVRNRVIHGYFGIDDTILFTTVHDELKALCRGWRGLPASIAVRGVEQRSNW
jgi:uncharacterized protein with HEPN domain